LPRVVEGIGETVARQHDAGRAADHLVSLPEARPGRRIHEGGVDEGREDVRVDLAPVGPGRVTGLETGLTEALVLVSIEAHARAIRAFLPDIPRRADFFSSGRVDAGPEQSAVARDAWARVRRPA